jgi:hypothetical protein
MKIYIIIKLYFNDLLKLSNSIRIILTYGFNKINHLALLIKNLKIKVKIQNTPPFIAILRLLARQSPNHRKH